MKGCSRIIFMAFAVILLIGGVQRISAILKDPEINSGFFAQEPTALFTNTEAEEAFTKEKEAEPQDENILYTYNSPENIEFISYCTSWSTEKLQELYGELLQNEHGDELYSLSQVIVYPQKDENAAASHQSQSNYYSIPLDFPALPGEFTVSYQREEGIITLYDGDHKTTVTQMASSLSHEYGHHYTRYYMFGNETEEELRNSEYLSLRGVDPTLILTDMEDTQYYYDNHHRYLLEIAAEDYVVLMGSPNSREVSDYLDSRQMLLNNDFDGKPITRNAEVQENLTIPMATELPELAAYFYSHLNKEAPQYDPVKEMNINIQKRTVSYNLVTGYEYFTHYIVSWDKVYGENAVYTLTAFSEEDYANSRNALITVTEGEKAAAYIGRYVIEYGNSVRYTEAGVATGTKTFVVNVITQDGVMYTSNPFSYTFE